MLKIVYKILLGKVVVLTAGNKMVPNLLMFLPLSPGFFNCFPIPVRVFKIRTEFFFISVAQLEIKYLSYIRVAQDFHTPSIFAKSQDFLVFTS